MSLTLADTAIDLAELPGLPIALESLEQYTVRTIVAPADPTDAIAGTADDVAMLANSGTISMLGEGFGADWYGRIHVYPSLLALGNVVSDQLRTVYVWNAFLDRNIALSDFTTSDADGIAITPPGSLPLVFGPLQERAWQVTVSTIGAPTIDALLTFDFGVDGTRLSEITGNRLTAWVIPPDWSGGVRESLAWLTDILQARNGVSQKRACRIAPRRGFEFDVIADGQQRRVLDAMLADWSGRVWGLPIWHDGQRLTTPLAIGATSIAIDTTGLDFHDGGLVMLWTAVNTFAVLEIDTVADAALTLKHATQRAWARGAWVWPVRTARLASDAEQSLWNDAAGTVRPSFGIIDACDWPEAWLGPTYRGYPVFELRPDEGQDPRVAYPRMIDTIDNDTGIPSVIDWAGVGFPQRSHRWILEGRAARTAFRSLLYAFHGRRNEAWFPSWTSDLQLIAPALSTASALVVEWAGYTRFGTLQINRRDIRIELNDGTILYRRITATAELDDASEQLAIDAPLGVDITARSVRSIGFMALSELASDRIEIQHETDADGIAIVALAVKAVKRDV